MNDTFKQKLLQVTGASSFTMVEEIQSLWSGYGKILRYSLNNSEHKTVVVKHVQLHEKERHPRGWNTDLSHQRKLKSYQVETVWYENYSHLCNNHCRIPHCLGIEQHNNEVFIVLEDLDNAGFGARKNSVAWQQVELCLSWLANFHATFLGIKPENLWEIGTYWHLDTRPDELDDLNDTHLKQAAHAIDKELTESRFQTFVHGDAKLANFCFSAEGSKVAAVDFQYVGGGCGMKDVAYFVGSCMREADCEKYESQVLNFYFQALQEALNRQNKNIDFKALETEWRSLYPVAWTDFHRFLKGWSPGHWKINTYSERVARLVIEQLNKK